MLYELIEPFFPFLSFYAAGMLIWTFLVSWFTGQFNLYQAVFWPISAVGFLGQLLREIITFFKEWLFD